VLWLVSVLYKAVFWWRAAAVSEEEEGDLWLYFITPLEVSIFLLSLTFQVPMCAMPGKVRRWFSEHLWRLYLQSLSPIRVMLHRGSPNRRGKRKSMTTPQPQWHSKKTRMHSFISKAPLRINTLIFFLLIPFPLSLKGGVDFWYRRFSTGFPLLCVHYETSAWEPCPCVRDCSTELNNVI